MSRRDEYSQAILTFNKEVRAWLLRNSLESHA